VIQEIKEALSYDDVLLVPKFSDIHSRKDVNLSTYLTKKIKLNIPTIPANMDTVCEYPMAIAMARAGGIGIIHRFMTIEEQVNQVLEVKRAEAVIIENPYTLYPENTIAEAKELMVSKNITGILVTDNLGKFLGIVTHRDLIFETNQLRQIGEIMTLKEKAITSNVDTTPELAKELFKQYKIEKLPLVDNSGVLKGLITSKDLMRIEQHPLASKDFKGRLLVGAAIGVKIEDVKRAEALIKAGCDVLCIDIAHGHSDLVINMIKELKKKFEHVQIIAGNVATAEGTRDLILAGADAVKCGVGSGSICITRIVAGAGIPQITAIVDCAKVAHEYNVPLIADGGIKQPGDLTKALAAGASAVMMGGQFAGTDESPGQPIIKDGKKFKVYRGSAGFGTAMARRQKEKGDDNISEVVPEGVEGVIPYRGSVVEILYQYLGGLRSGMSYIGAHNIQEMWKNAEFVKISSAGLKESYHHDIDKI
jgi:IMP dehydrogenase